MKIYQAQVKDNTPVRCSLSKEFVILTLYSCWIRDLINSMNWYKEAERYTDLYNYADILSKGTLEYFKEVVLNNMPGYEIIEMELE